MTRQTRRENRREIRRQNRRRRSACPTVASLAALLSLGGLRGVDASSNGSGDINVEISSTLDTNVLMDKLVTLGKTNQVMKETENQPGIDATGELGRLVRLLKMLGGLVDALNDSEAMTTTLGNLKPGNNSITTIGEIDKTFKAKEAEERVKRVEELKKELDIKNEDDMRIVALMNNTKGGHAKYESKAWKDNIDATSKALKFELAQLVVKAIVGKDPKIDDKDNNNTNTLLTLLIEKIVGVIKSGDDEKSILFTILNEMTKFLGKMKYMSEEDKKKQKTAQTKNEEKIYEFFLALHKKLIAGDSYETKNNYLVTMIELEGKLDKIKDNVNENSKNQGNTTETFRKQLTDLEKTGKMLTELMQAVVKTSYGVVLEIKSNEVNSEGNKINVKKDNVNDNVNDNNKEKNKNMRNNGGNKPPVKKDNVNKFNSRREVNNDEDEVVNMRSRRETEELDKLTESLKAINMTADTNLYALINNVVNKAFGIDLKTEKTDATGKLNTLDVKLNESLTNALALLEKKDNNNNPEKKDNNNNPEKKDKDKKDNNNNPKENNPKDKNLFAILNKLIESNKKLSEKLTELEKAEKDGEKKQGDLQEENKDLKDQLNRLWTAVKFPYVTEQFKMNWHNMNPLDITAYRCDVECGANNPGCIEKQIEATTAVSKEERKHQKKWTLLGNVDTAAKCNKTLLMMMDGDYGFDSFSPKIEEFAKYKADLAKPRTATETKAINDQFELVSKPENKNVGKVKFGKGGEWSCERSKFQDYLDKGTKDSKCSKEMKWGDTECEATLFTCTKGEGNTRRLTAEDAEPQEHVYDLKISQEHRLADLLVHNENASNQSAPEMHGEQIRETARPPNRHASPQDDSESIRLVKDTNSAQNQYLARMVQEE